MTVVFLIVPIIDIFTFNDRKKANWYYTFILDSEYTEIIQMNTEIAHLQIVRFEIW